MIDWKPITEIDTTNLRSEPDTYLLWVPNLRVSGPGIACFWQNKSWKVAANGFDLQGQPTHYAFINDPTWDGEDC